MDITREKYNEADDFYMSFQDKLSYCQARIKNLLDCPLREINIDEFNDYIKEEKQLRAIIEALTEYKERLGLIDDQGAVLIKE
jgi:hypothetical protein